MSSHPALYAVQEAEAIGTDVGRRLAGKLYVVIHMRRRAVSSSLALCGNAAPATSYKLYESPIMAFDPPSRRRVA